MNQLQSFQHSKFGELQILIKDGKEFFPATDVAIKLGYSNPRDAIVKHCREDGVAFYDVIDSMGRTQQKKFINEGNLYRLIVKSKLPSAEKFEQWVFDEVLPTIRKTGSYSIKKLDSYMIDDPIERAKRWIEEQEEKIAIQQQLQIAAPKAEMYDVALSADNAQTMSIVAKTLGYGRNRLFAFLREQGVLRQNNEPYQEFIDRGYFRIRQVPISRSSGTQNKPQTLVTAKGMDYIAKLLKKHGLLKRAL